MDTVAVFCAIDDFYQWFEPWWEQRLLELAPKRRRAGLCLSEVMTIMVGFHLSGYRTFKHYYLGEVLRHQRPYFPGLVSYNRFVDHHRLTSSCTFVPNVQSERPAENEATERTKTPTSTTPPPSKPPRSRRVRLHCRVRQHKVKN